MSREEDDWHSAVMDDDGNYYQDGRLPDEVSRGSAPQRLNMEHGFMRHIAQNQNARMQFESQNPSSSIQQRYIAEPHSPDTWRRSLEDEEALALHSRGDDVKEYTPRPEDTRYRPPHVRQQQPPGIHDEAAESRRESRRYRPGHAAYTAPPLLTKRSALHPAAVQSDSPAAPSSTPPQPAQQAQGHVSAAGNTPVGHPAAGSVAQHPLACSDYPPGFSSTLTTIQASTANPSLSPVQNGSAQATVSSTLAQPLCDPLPPHKHGTWSSEGEEETPLQNPEHDAPPGYGPSGSGPPGTQTPAASSRAAGNGPVQAGSDLPPGFAGRAVQEPSYMRGSVGKDYVPKLATAHEWLTPSNQDTQHSNVDQPPGFSQSGMAQLKTPVSAAMAHTPQPAETSASVSSSAKTGRKGRTHASSAASPATSAGASQLPAAASSAPQPADLPPGFSAIASPSFHPAEPRSTGILPTRSQGRAPSSRFHTTTAGSALAGTAEKPPGFDTAGDSVPQTYTHAPQQQLAGALQSQRSVQGSSKPQQLPQQNLQGPKQQAVPQSNVASASVSVSGDLPPGFCAISQMPAPAVQSASRQWQPSSSKSNLSSSSAAVSDDLPPGFRAQSRLPAPAVQSRSGLPSQAPNIVNLATLSSALTAAQSSLHQTSPALPADGLPPGFSSAVSAASVSHSSSLRAQSSTPAAAANDLPPGFPTAPSAAAASLSQPGSRQARPLSAAPYQAATGQSGWDTDETKVDASTSHPQSHVRHPHAAAADADLPPGFLDANQQPASASRPSSASRPLSSTRSQRQPSAGAPVLERKVILTKLPTTPISGLSSAFSADAPVQAQRTVTVSKLPASPSPGPHSMAPSAPQSSGNSKRKSHGQAMTQPPGAAAAGDSSSDLPPGFSTMQRSSSTPSAPAAAATMSRATAVQAFGSTVAAGRGASSSAAADLPPGFPRLGAVPQDPADLPPGFAADSASAHTPKAPAMPKSSKKEAGRRAQVPLPQPGPQRSDARRKAQMPKAASDNLGELPPGFTASQGPVQPVARQGPNQDAPDFPPGYHVGQLGQAFSAGHQQDAREQTTARPSSSSMTAPDVPPGLPATSTHSTANAQSGHPMSRSSPSPSGFVRPSVPTLALGALLGSDSQSAVSQQADTPAFASHADQSAFQQRVSGSGPFRPQRTPVPDPGRGASSQAPDRPPGFSTVPVPQSLGSAQMGGFPHLPSSSDSSAYVSSHMQSQHDWPQSHQAPSAAAPCFAPTGPPSTIRPNVQDVRQSVYDNPHRQLSNTSGGQQPSAEDAAHWSTSQAQHQTSQASAAMHSQAVDAEATATEAAQSVAGMDVRQSMYNSSQDIRALDDSWVSLHRSQPGDCQILTLHSDQAAPVDESSSHAPQYSWAEPDWAGDNSQQPQSLDAHPSWPFGAVPNRSSSDAQLDQQGHWQEKPEQEMLPRIPSASLSLSLHGHQSQRQQVHSPADRAQHAQCAQHERQRGQQEPQRGQRELQPGQHDPEDVEHDKHTSATIYHEAQQRSRADELSPQSMHAQSAHADQGNGSTRDANRRYADRASYSAAATARQPEVTVPHGTASAAAAPARNPARHASKAPWQASMPVNGQSGWDLDELDVTGTTSQPHSHETRQPLSLGNSSSLGSEQEAVLWDLVNEEPYQIGLTVQQQQRGNSCSQHRSSAQHAQHSAIVSSQQSSQQSNHQAARISSSRPSSADSSSQANQQYGHRPERVPASQMHPGEFQSAGHWPHSEEQSSSQSTANRAPQKLKHAVRRMAWVRPKPKPADKLESVQWEDEKQTAPPWKNLKAFTREKKNMLMN